MGQFGTKDYRSISAWLDPTALQTTRGVVLAQTVVEELRKRLIVLPPVAVIERLCAEAMTRAQRKVFALLTEGLDDEQRTKLDQLLEQREGSPYSTLVWLRMPPGAPTPRTVLGHIERLSAIRGLALSPDVSQKLHQNRLLQLAREAGQTAVYQFKEYEQARRHSTLVALMIETAATLIDEIVDLNDRLIGSFFTRSKNKYEQAFSEQGKAIKDKVRLYAKIGAALVDAREQGRHPFAAIEAVVPWASFSASVKEAAELARGEDFDALSLVGEHYPQLRRYAPALIETLHLSVNTFPFLEVPPDTIHSHWRLDKYVYLADPTTERKKARRQRLNEVAVELGPDTLGIDSTAMVVRLLQPVDVELAIGVCGCNGIMSG